MTNGTGYLAHGIVAHIEVAEALAFYETRREGREEVVRKGEPAGVSVSQDIVHLQPAQHLRGALQGAPLDFDPDDINDLVGQAGYVLVAKVDGDAGLLLQFPGSIWATLAMLL